MFNESNILNMNNFIRLMDGVLVKSSSELLKSLLVYSVAKNMRKRGRIPDSTMLTIRSGALARAIQSDENIEQKGTSLSDGVISAEKGIESRYASVHEYGGTFPLRNNQLRAMFGRLKRDKQYDESKVKPRGTSDRTYTFPPRPFIRPSIEHFSADLTPLKRIIKANLQNAFIEKKMNVTIR